MADLLEGTLSLNLVAIDIARYSNAVLIELPGGKRQRFRMTNSAADFDRLLDYLQVLPGNCRVALEPTGDYHRPLAHRLLRAGHEVVSINSVAQARYREAMFNSWDKNDPKDALVILEMLRRGTYQRYVDPLIEGHHDLQELAKTYYQVSRARTKVQHSLINHCLPLYFPEMHRYWCTTRNEWFVRFLLEFRKRSMRRAFLHFPLCRIGLAWQVRQAEDFFYALRSGCRAEAKTGCHIHGVCGRLSRAAIVAV
jgi:transposase